ncbi:peptide ABC transporter substrate-binding protein [Rhodoferax sp.]|uniref:peptide ABC transporter substrate-binding protein n=1 Tax=Rhodoferax sp. TaxID=50421 RepID=UPI00274833DF|nr:peptide ABC transporter substrate-binding protein [Rhodoferax sp.]
MSTQRALHGIALAVALCSGAPSWAAIVPPGTVLHAKQELIRNNGSEPETLDPAVAESVGGNNIARDLFEGLTASDNTGKVVPGVAESWKQIDPTTWVFTLRKNATWSNGEAITAPDFVYGWQRFLNPKTASPYATTFGIFIQNGFDIASGKKPPTELGVKALDKHTLEVKTAMPVSFLPDLMSNTQFAPAHRASIEKFGKDWTKPGNMVGNGAYVLKAWQVNSKLVIEKSPKYWDHQAVILTKVTYLPVEDGNADVKLFQSGENEWVYQLPPGTYAALKKSHPTEIRNAPMLGLRYYSLYNLDPMMKDVRVRKALSMVIDRDVLAQKITADGQVPAYGVVVKGVAGADVVSYDWATWPMAQRVAEAKKLLAEAGIKPGTKIKFTYNTSEYHKKMAIFAASEWKTKLGLETEMDNLEFKVLLKKRHDGDFQIARNGWVADYNDVTTFLTIVQCGSDQNDNKNCNKQADELTKQGTLSMDPAKRKALLTQAAKVVMEDYPMIPLLQYTLPRLVKSYVGGYSELNVMDRFRNKDLYIIKH